MFKKRMLFAFPCIFSLLVARSATATNFPISGKVTFIESSYMPLKIRFTMDHGDGVCGLNSSRPNLYWENSNADNNKAVFAMLLAAYIGQQNITLYYSDANSSYQAEGAGNCVTSYIYLNP